MRAIVIGAGVVGSAIAWRLAWDGIKVEVHDRGALGKEASWAAAGFMAPQAEADGPGPLVNFCVEGLKYFDSVYPRLVAESGVEAEYNGGGVLYVALNEEEKRELEGRLEWQKNVGLKQAEVLDNSRVREFEPALSPQVVCALYFRDEKVIDNRKLTEAFIRAALKAGAVFHACSAVEEIVIRGGRVAGVRLGDGMIREADLVVNAAGAWAGALKGCEADRVSTRPVRGQILCFEAPPGKLRHAVIAPRGYVVPRANGRILAGTTREESGYDKSVTLEGIASIANTARALLPSLGSIPLRELWAGLRPAAPDLLPVIGPSPTLEGLYYATGHYRNGILLAALTAEIISQLVAGKPPAIDLTPYLPARFASASG